MAIEAAALERYQRHILLKEIGGAGQQKLSAARVLIIGMGGLGNPLAQYLAAAGVGHLGLVDDDKVTASNLQRQTLFTPDDVGQSKVTVAAARLAAQNPLVHIEPHITRLGPNNAEALIGAYDLVADACDNYQTRFTVNDTCFRLRKTLISAAVGRFDGQLATFKPWLSDADGTPLPCYRSLVPEMPDAQEDCATTGIIGALTGILGSLQALEVIKEITGAGDSLAGRLLVFDGLSMQARTIRLAWDPANPNNGRPG